jgi:hypothetical protein
MLIAWPERLQSDCHRRHAPLSYILTIILSLSFLAERILFLFPIAWQPVLFNTYAQGRLYMDPNLHQPWQWWSAGLLLDDALGWLLTLLIWPVIGAAVERQLGSMPLLFLIALIMPLSGAAQQLLPTGFDPIPIHQPGLIVLGGALALGISRRLHIACAYLHLSAVVLRRFSLPLFVPATLILLLEWLRCSWYGPWWTAPWLLATPVLGGGLAIIGFYQLQAFFRDKP